MGRQSPGAARQPGPAARGERSAGRSLEIHPVPAAALQLCFAGDRYILDGKKKWTLSRPENYAGLQTGVCFFTLSLSVQEFSDSLQVRLQR